MRPKKREVERGSWTAEVDGQQVELTGRQVIVYNRDGTVRRKAFKAKGELADGTKMRVKDRTRFRG